MLLLLFGNVLLMPRGSMVRMAMTWTVPMPGGSNGYPFTG
jgi:hypothetical protein